MRVFLGIDFDSDTKRRMVEAAERLRRGMPGRMRWEGADKLHLTLKFLGPVAEAGFAEVNAAAERIAAATPAMTLRIGGLGTFPPEGPPRVLWLGAQEATGALMRLAVDLDAAMAALGFGREAHPFHPHVTLARISEFPGGRRPSDGVPDAGGFAAMSVAARELTVFESEPTPQGSRYTRLAAHAFGGGGANGEPS